MQRASSEVDDRHRYAANRRIQYSTNTCERAPGCVCARTCVRIDQLSCIQRHLSTNLFAHSATHRPTCTYIAPPVDQPVRTQRPLSTNLSARRAPCRPTCWHTSGICGREALVAVSRRHLAVRVVTGKSSAPESAGSGRLRLHVLREHNALMNHHFRSIDLAHVLQQGNRNSMILFMQIQL